MNIWDMALKDMLRSLRNVFMLGMALVAPLLITGLVYFAFGGLSSGKITIPPLQVGWVNEDQPPAGQPALGEMLTTMLSDASVSAWLVARELPDEAAARAALDRREIGLALLVPSDFSAVILSGQGETRLLLVQDPTLTIGPVVVKDMIAMFLDGVAEPALPLTLIADEMSAAGQTLAQVLRGALTRTLSAAEMARLSVALAPPVLAGFREQGSGIEGQGSGSGFVPFPGPGPLTPAPRAGLSLRPWSEYNGRQDEVSTRGQAMDFLKRAWQTVVGAAGGGVVADSDPNGVWFHFRCKRCGTVVRVRANKAADFNYEEGGPGARRFAKEVMDSKCFQLMRAEIWLDGSYSVVAAEVQGGELISLDEYEAAQNAAKP
jgi:hypothetical protein